MNQVILTDLFDQELGTMEKAAAHAQSHLHRAFSVFLYRGQEMLIQQRALDKYHSGGLWTNTCCSHPQPGEETKAAAIRRLAEETGIRCADLKEVFSFVYYHAFHEDLYEYEYDHVLIGEYDGPFQADPQEIASMEWVPFDTLAEDLLKHPEKYSPWFLTAAPKVLSLLKEEG